MNDINSSKIIKEDENILYSSGDKIKILDLLKQTEVCILLFDQPELRNVYNGLLELDHLKLLFYLKQKQIAEYIGISEPTFILRRDKLEKLNIITIKGNYHHKIIEFNTVQSLQKFAPFQDSIQKRLEYIKEQKKKIAIETPDFMQEKQEELEKQQVDQKIKEEAKEIVKEEKRKEDIKKKSEEAKYPNEDYQIVLNNYKKYRGVGISPNYILGYKKLIKQMFLAGYKPKDIVDCMQFFDKYKKVEGNEWMNSWHLGTIFKKIPLFIAKQLYIKKSMADDYPDIE